MRITAEEQAEFDNATKCWICGDQFDDDDDQNEDLKKVRDIVITQASIAVRHITNEI